MLEICVDLPLDSVVEENTIAMTRLFGVRNADWIVDPQLHRLRRWLLKNHPIHPLMKESWMKCSLCLSHLPLLLERLIVTHLTNLLNLQVVKSLWAENPSHLQAQAQASYHSKHHNKHHIPQWNLLLVRRHKSQHRRCTHQPIQKRATFVERTGETQIKGVQTHALRRRAMTAL